MKDKLVQRNDYYWRRRWSGGSVFIAGKGDDFKLPLKDRFRNKRYQMRRKRVEKKELGPEALQKKRLYFMQKKKMVFFR